MIMVKDAALGTIMTIMKDAAQDMTTIIVEDAAQEATMMVVAVDMISKETLVCMGLSII